eukprot:TRINITY_DN15112_c0_g1_i3.p1 TRINITY_DN15112_c0_g1~~TRINITY_DN15112_c0_g1_i3.p1  ORF type:complete len:108 (+),score=8.10 TRINITY_DN15112_c0_g1_i3:109-432(+)
MLRSLVGSEMCIRDSISNWFHQFTAVVRRSPHSLKHRTTTKTTKLSRDHRQLPMPSIGVGVVKMTLGGGPLLRAARSRRVLSLFHATRMQEGRAKTGLGGWGCVTCG